MKSRGLSSHGLKNDLLLRLQAEPVSDADGATPFPSGDVEVDLSSPPATLHKKKRRRPMFVLSSDEDGPQEMRLAPDGRQYEED